jgi:AhpD family alkylhydroperoxidase
MNLDEKTMRLIAVGASISANCQPCLEINTAKAREEGIAEQEIAEAIKIGKMVRQGAASKMDKFAQSLDYGAAPSASAEAGGCGCAA